MIKTGRFCLQLLKLLKNPDHTQSINIVVYPIFAVLKAACTSEKFPGELLMPPMYGGVKSKSLYCSNEWINS